MRQKHFLLAIPLVAVLMFLQSCTKTEQVALTLPTVTSFTPTSGLPGTSVTITGTNFDPNPANNLVAFNGLQATVTAASATSLTVTIPANAPTGTAAKITVTAKGLTAVSADNFTVSAVPPVQTTEITTDITTDTHWTADMHILLKNWIYVTAGHTLTIDPGTVIKGDKATKAALIIERGAKIMAIGTAAKPIIFTSNQPLGQRNYGDWGGVILCGKAPTNWKAYKDAISGNIQPAGIGQVEGGPRSLYGGAFPHNYSGQLSYVRIEFGGVAFSQDNEINGLTLCAVGDSTVLDHIQVSYAGDDSFEFFGGTVNAKYLIAHRGLDDDFDTDNGFSGKVQFGVALRDPNVADQSGSKAFESDSYQGTTVLDGSFPTTCKFSNMTVVGGVVNPNSTAYDPQFVAAVHLRKGSQLQLANSVIISHPVGILVSNEIGQTGQSYTSLGQALPDVINIKNTLVGGIPTLFQSGRIAYGIAPVSSPATFDQNVVVVTNNIRSRTPTTPQIDSVTNSAFFTGYSGPYHWLGSDTYYNLAVKNRFVYTAQTGVRLTNPYTLTNPNFFPTSTSPITVNAGPTSGVGIDASGQVPFGTNGTNAVPKLSPSFTGAFADTFFDNTVTFIGAFGAGGTDWTLGWVNWDPNNADYGDAY